MQQEIATHHYHTILVWYLVQHSLSAFQKIVHYFGNCEQALIPQHRAKWSQLGLHSSHLKRLHEFQTATGQKNFLCCLEQIKKHTDFIVTTEDSTYPSQLLPYTDYPPILFGQGESSVLLQPQIAIVGSRKPSSHGKQVAYDFAYYLSDQGFFINSGLAQGIDEAAHQGGLQHQRTLAVMATGLDRTYPTAHMALREKIAEYGAVITEFLPGTPPLQQNFPRRNRIVSGLSLGVLVVEAKQKSGSLITAHEAAKQGKVIFAIPGHIYSDFHQGCHQLIREGAILVDHPEQMIEDLALPTQWQINQQKKTTAVSSEHPNIPDHLITLYQQLDWTGQSLEQLAVHFAGSTAELIGQLMELELAGLCLQQAGVYQRCRKSH